MLTAMQEQVQAAQSTAVKGRSYKRLVFSLLGVFAVLIMAVAGIGFLAVRKAASIYHGTRARVMGSEPALNAAKSAPPPAKPMALTQPCATLPRDQSAALRQ